MGGAANVCFAEEESLTITTYYPSPYGSYRELSAHRMKIGLNYSTQDVTDNNLIVEGGVGIGTNKIGSGYKLDVQGLTKMFSLDTDSINVTKDLYLNKNKIFVKEDPLSLCVAGLMKAFGPSKTCVSGGTSVPVTIPSTECCSKDFTNATNQCQKLCNEKYLGKTCVGSGDCATSCAAYPTSFVDKKVYVGGGAGPGGAVIYANTPYTCHCTGGVTCNYYDCSFTAQEKCLELK